MAIWQDAGHIYSNRYVPGIGWGTESLVELFGSASTTPQIAMDAMGRAITVWAIAGSVYANHYEPGVGWGTPTVIEALGGTSYDPQLAMDASGNAVAVWYWWSGTRYDIWANVYTPTTGWGTQVRIESGAGSAYDPEVVLDPFGNATVVWYQWDGTFYSTYANRFVPALGWEGATLVETNDGSAYRPRLAVDPSGNVMTVWAQHDGVAYSLWSNRYVPGFGWGNATLVEGNNGGVYVWEWPAIAFDDAGNAFAAWSQHDGARYSVYANRFVPGTGWETPLLLENENFGDGRGVQVAADWAGNAIALWHQFDGARWNVLSSRYLHGVGWGSATHLETEMSSALDPQVAMDPSGNAVAVWWSGQIWANRFVRDDVAPALMLTSPGSDLTNDPNVIVAGTTEPGALLTINGTSVPVDGMGGFSLAATLTDGLHTFDVVATDIEGNSNIASTRVTVDTTPPALALASPADGALLTAPTVSVAGTTEADARLIVDGIVVEVKSDGTFAFTAALVEGPNTIAASATDRAGNTNVVTRSVVVDTIGPGLVITSPTTGLTNDPNVVVAGTTEPGATVTVDGTAVPVDPSGTFSHATTQPDGTHTYALVARDAAGNSDRATATVTVDTVPPSLTLDAPADGAVLTSSILSVSGATEPGARLVVNGVVAEVQSDGSFGLTLVLADGTHTISALATDPAGNAITVSHSITVDTVGPGLAITSPTVPLTNDPNVVVAGLTSPGASVVVEGAAVTVDANGAFSHAMTLPDGTHAISVVATDAAGNADRSTVRITVDTVAPSLTVTSPTNGATFTVPTAVVTGTTEAGARLVVNGIVVQVAADGSFSFPIALRDGPNTIVARASDAAGNVASSSVTVTFANPVPGLEQQLQDVQDDLAATRDELSATQGELAATQDELTATRGDLQDTRGSLADTRNALASTNANLAAQVTLLTALIVVLAVLGAVLVLLSLSMRKKLAALTGTAVEADEQSPPET